MISKIKPSINRFAEKIARPFAHILHPNTLTLIGFLLALIPIILLSQKKYLWGALSFILLCADMLDGAIARVAQKESLFGGYLDAVLDRIVDGLIIIALVWSGAAQPIIGLLCVLNFSLVSYTKAKGEGVLGLRKMGANILAIGFAERGVRLALIFIALLFFSFSQKTIIGLNILEMTLLILVILSIVTSLQRIINVMRELKKSVQ